MVGFLCMQCLQQIELKDATFAHLATLQALAIAMEQLILHCSN